ncbi:MAG: universal stress protein [Pseudomonadota bacterium]
MPNQKQKKILLSVDGSERAFDSVEYIGDMAPFRNMQVALYTVFSGIPVCYWDMEKQPKATTAIREVKEWEHNQRKIIREYIEKAGNALIDAGFSEKNISVNIHEREDGVARDIVKESQNNYCAVAIGRTGGSRLREIVLGSIALKLLEKMSFGPTLIVGGKKGFSEKALIALDGSEGAMRAVDFVGDMLSGSAFNISLLHIIRWDIGFEGEAFFTPQEHAEPHNPDVEMVFKDAIQRLVDKGIDSKDITTKIVSGVYSRAGAIVQEAAESGIGTIVVGRRGLSKVQEFFMGRVSNKVIQLAKKHAVWVVS